MKTKDSYVVLGLSLIVLGGFVLFLSQRMESDRRGDKMGQSKVGDETSKSMARLEPGMFDEGSLDDEIIRRGDTQGSMQASEDNVVEDSVPAPVRAAAHQALGNLKTAARAHDKAFLEELNKVGNDCEWCDSFYKLTRQELRNTSLRSDEQAYMARALANSGITENAMAVAQMMEQAANHPESGVSPSVFSQALADSTLPSDVVDEIGSDLDSSNPYLREAAVSILTKQGTVSAAQELYNDYVQRGDPDHFYQSGMGLGQMKPQAETVPYLEQLVAQKDQYSSLAVKALLNYGTEGLERAVAVLGVNASTEIDSQILRGAVPHVSLDSASLTLLGVLSAGSGQGALKDFATQVLKEHQIDIDNHKRALAKTAYNQNTVEP